MAIHLLPAPLKQIFEQRLLNRGYKSSILDSIYSQIDLLGFVAYDQLRPKLCFNNAITSVIAASPKEIQSPEQSGHDFGPYLLEFLLLV